MPEPDGAAVELDADIYVPPSGEGPFPALIVAHGFGGSKDQLSVQAQEYADAGYLVLAYTARGFGESGGQIHLMVPALEGADVSSLVDYLATRDDVRQDADNDPRVGIAGGSYGGAAALMGSALDERIDAAVALVTWNDLAQSLFAQHATTDEQPATPAGLTPIDTPGVFKRLWGSRFFAAALAGGPPMSTESASPAEPAPETPETPEPSPPATPPAPTPPHSTNPMLCGRFEPTLCAHLTAAAETGIPDQALLDTSARTPGKRDHHQDAADPPHPGPGGRPFDSTRRTPTPASSTTGAPLASAGPTAATTGPPPPRPTTNRPPGLAHSAWPPTSPPRKQPGSPCPSTRSPTPSLIRRQVTATLELDAYPGLSEGDQSVTTSHKRTSSQDQLLLNPPGGQPASMTTIPGLAAGVRGLPTYALAALPGSSGSFETIGLPDRRTVAGSPRLRLTVTSTGEEQVLYASLWQLQGSTLTQPRALVAPIRIQGPAGQPHDVTVALPAAAYAMEQGTRWRVLLTTTDNGHAGPQDARADRIEIVDAAIELPVVTGTRVPAAGEGGRDTESWAVGAALVALLLTAAILAVLRRRRRTRDAYRETSPTSPSSSTDSSRPTATGTAPSTTSPGPPTGQVVGLRPQRRRQDHDDADDARPDHPDSRCGWAADHARRRHPAQVGASSRARLPPAPDRPTEPSGLLAGHRPTREGCRIPRGLTSPPPAAPSTDRCAPTHTA